MKWTIREQITELNQTYNNLGEDLLMIESVIIASHCENEYPSEYIMSSLYRAMDYTEQHLGEIASLAKSLLQKAHPCRENPKQYGRDLRHHPETDASPDTRAIRGPPREPSGAGRVGKRRGKVMECSFRRQPETERNGFRPDEV